MGILDMTPQQFEATDKKLKLYSTLDHGVERIQDCVRNQMVINVVF